MRLFESTGEMAEAKATLLTLTHRAISDGSEDVPDLIGKLRDMGASVEAIQNLESRVEAASVATAAELPSPLPDARELKATIFFVGCDSLHADFREAVVDAIQADHPNSLVKFVLPGWGSSWARILKSMEPRLERADAIVLTRFVRTHLGRTVRRIASEKSIPWVACTGQGRTSIERSIRQAITVVHRQGAARAESSPVL